jgi:hypothetical protein
MLSSEISESESIGVKSFRLCSSWGSKRDLMTIQQTPQAEQFKQQLRDSLQHETMNSRAVKIPRHSNVYTCGDQDEMVYFIESGQIKLLMLSSDGRECLLAIHSAGDVFGELCLSGLGARLETATAMKATVLKAKRSFEGSYRMPAEPELKRTSWPEFRSSVVIS